MNSIIERIAALDWPGIAASLEAEGSATTGMLLTPAECAALPAAYEDDALFRNRVVMERHGYGRGEYRYFAYPLPSLVAGLRQDLYARLAPIANRWETMLGRPAAYPPTHAEFAATCHAAGQTRPTPLLLRYGAGDYNCLHQDLYGATLFPLQVAFLLSDPGTFSGGEFILTEQRPRMQSRAEVVGLRQGEGVIFAVNQRPVRGARGITRVAMRHGVSRIRHGSRFTLGVIFHDAA